ncbi:nucleotide-binding alpha-beta plait domain-containing protein [Tanacetum coccineum]
MVFDDSLNTTFVLNENLGPVRLAFNERDLERVLLKPRHVRDDSYGCLFKQSGSVETQGQSSGAGDEIHTVNVDLNVNSQGFLLTTASATGFRPTGSPLKRSYLSPPRVRNIRMPRFAHASGGYGTSGYIGVIKKEGFRMGSMRSKEDEALKIATSVFVINFPDHFIAKDLWNTCKQYGTVVDAFIPNRRSKAASLTKSSKQFNNNGENMINTGEAHKDKEVKGYSNSYANVLRGSQPINMEMENNPALVLDNSCLNHQDYSNFLMGKVKDFASLSNLKVVLVKDGYDNIKLKYMGGYWQASNDFIIDGRVTWVEIEGIPLKMWSANTFARIASKCGKVFWVHAKEIPRWVPDFVEDNDEETDTDEETNKGESNGEDEEIPKTNVKEVSVGQKDAHSVDPFNLYDLLNKKQDDSNKGHNVDDSLKYPPGYTPIDKKDATDEHSNKSNESKRASGECFQSTHEEEGVFRANKSCSKNISKEDVAESICSCHFQKAEIPRSGGSILQLMDNLVKVG